MTESNQQSKPEAPPSNLPQDGQRGMPPGGRPASESPLAQLAQLLAAEKAAGEPDKEGAEDDAGKPKPKQKPKNLAELAKALNVEPADLYAIQVPSAREGAEPYTLGKLKDLAAEHDAFTIRSLELEETNRKRHGEFLRAEQELQAILATLPADAIKAEVRAALQAKRDKAMALERQRVLEVIPEWKDVDVRTQELEQISEHLKDWGFPEHYLSGVMDHRTLRYIRENWRREKQIRAALEKVAERKPQASPKSKPVADVKKPAASSKGPMPYEQQRVTQFGRTILGARK